VGTVFRLRVKEDDLARWQAVAGDRPVAQCVRRAMEEWIARETSGAVQRAAQAAEAAVERDPLTGGPVEVPPETPRAWRCTRHRKLGCLERPCVEEAQG